MSYEHFNIVDTCHRLSEIVPEYDILRRQIELYCNSYAQHKLNNPSFEFDVVPQHIVSRCIWCEGGIPSRGWKQFIHDEIDKELGLLADEALTN